MMHTKLLAILTTTSAALAATATADTVNPLAQPDESYVSFSGEVTSATASLFNVDIGERIVTVEMDDWDNFGDAWPISPGDDVTVYGYVDDDFLEAATIEASSVYVDDANTFFYASGADEESIDALVGGMYDFDFELTGKVTQVNGREFMMEVGDTTFNIDTIHMAYNPMDKEGYQHVRKGDRVTVFGDLDASIWDEAEINAEAIISREQGAEDNNPGEASASAY